jgi:O-methyltransferase involved in polyketide biosynthesis
LGNVQMTLFMPVWARAVETKKVNPVLVDKTAVEIIESVDFDFSQMFGSVTYYNCHAVRWQGLHNLNSRLT